MIGNCFFMFRGSFTEGSFQYKCNFVRLLYITLDLIFDKHCTHYVYSQLLQSAKIGQSTLAKRMCYTPPPKCLPKKLPLPDAGPGKPAPVFVQVSIQKPRDVFVSLLCIL